MPPVFKAVVTISVWVLFIKGWIAVLAGTYTSAVAGIGGAPVPLVAVGECGVGIIALILAAVAAKLRQMVE